VKLMKGDVVEDKHRLDSDSCKLVKHSLEMVQIGGA
jgi:hypothetical protein